MKITYLVGLFALSSAIGVATIGCGDSTETDDGGSGGSGATGGSPVGPGPSSSSAGGSGGGTGDGNDDFSEAVMIGIDGGQANGAFEDVNTDYDYYVFQGMAGQEVWIQTDAKPDTDPFADGYPDMVVTLYLDQGGTPTQIAENDDPIPRTTQDSELFTVLPETGTYYLRVGDFCWWEEDATGTNPCPGGAQDVSNSNAYAVAVASLDFAGEDTFVSEAEASTDIIYTANPNSPGNYFLNVLKGTFDDAADNDTNLATTPTFTPDAGERATFYVDVFPSGASGNGSTAETGDVWVSTSSDPTATPVLARIDASKLDPTFGMTLEMPFSPTTTYYLHTATASTAVGANPFYFLQHFIGGSNLVEVEGNDTIATAFANNAITHQMSSTGNNVFWFAGDLDQDGATDIVDHHYIDFASAGANLTTDNVFGACAATRIGSGLQGLTLELVDQNNTVISGTTLAENPDADTDYGDTGVTIPASTTELYAKVTATGQDATVSGEYYRCAIYFIDPSTL